jgi:glycine cleavage system aminomethyltransferase T
VTVAVRRSPVARSLVELGALLDVEGGWEIPASFGEEEHERSLLRETVGLADISSRGKIDVRGAIDHLVEDRGDAVVARVARGWAMLLTEPGGEAPVLRRLEETAGPSAMVTDVTHLFAAFALGGPQTPSVLARLTSWEPAVLARGEAAGAPIAGVTAIVRRDHHSPALELYVRTESAPFVWETVLGVVRGLGGGPVGVRTLAGQGWH